MKNRDGTRISMWFWIAVGVVSMVTLTHAEVVAIAPSKDNTLYEDPNGALSNGIGQHFFAGRTGITTNVVRRGVIAFDIAGNVPAGATIDSVTLTLRMSRAAFGATAQPFELKRLLADWGEGTSDATFQEGGGVASTPGDATWRHTFFSTQFWAADGGDFVGLASATRSVPGTIGFYDWGPTPQMAADVESWLDDPASNFGWILTGNDGQLQSARRFDSRENPEVTFRPVLTVEYTAGGDRRGRTRPRRRRNTGDRVDAPTRGHGRGHAELGRLVSDRRRRLRDLRGRPRRLHQPPSEGLQYRWRDDADAHACQYQRLLPRGAAECRGRRVLRDGQYRGREAGRCVGVSRAIDRGLSVSRPAKIQMRREKQEQNREEDP